MTFPSTSLPHAHPRHTSPYGQVTDIRWTILFECVIVIVTPTINIRRWHTRRTVWQRHKHAHIIGIKIQTEFLVIVKNTESIDSTCVYQDAPLQSFRLRNLHIRELQTHSARTVDVTGQYSACSSNKKELVEHDGQKKGCDNAVAPCANFFSPFHRSPPSFAAFYVVQPYVQRVVFYRDAEICVRSMTHMIETFVSFISGAQSDHEQHRLLRCTNQNLF